VEITPPEVDQGMLDEINNRFGADLDHATSVEDKLERQDATKALEEKIVSEFAGDPESEGYADRQKAAALAFAKAEKNVIRQRIAVQKKRPDGACDR
jgi:polyribonucleotide nucleotidyltransferase